MQKKKIICKHLSDNGGNFYILLMCLALIIITIAASFFNIMQTKIYYKTVKNNIDKACDIIVVEAQSNEVFANIIDGYLDGEALILNSVPTNHKANYSLSELYTYTIATILGAECNDSDSGIIITKNNGSDGATYYQVSNIQIYYGKHFDTKGYTYYYPNGVIYVSATVLVHQDSKDVTMKYERFIEV